jgi:hypothetical protein
VRGTKNRRSLVQASLGKKQGLVLKIINRKKAGGVSQVARASVRPERKKRRHLKGMGKAKHLR